MGELSLGCWNITSKYIVLHKHLVSRTLILSFLILSSFLKLIYYAFISIFLSFSIFVPFFFFLPLFLSFSLSFSLVNLWFPGCNYLVWSSMYSTVYLVVVVVVPPGPTMVIFYPYTELHTLPAWFCIYHREFQNPPPPPPVGFPTKVSYRAKLYESKIAISQSFSHSNTCNVPR